MFNDADFIFLLFFLFILYLKHRKYSINTTQPFLRDRNKLNPNITLWILRVIALWLNFDPIRRIDVVGYNKISLSNQFMMRKIICTHHKWKTSDVAQRNELIQRIKVRFHVIYIWRTMCFYNMPRSIPL